ncbi:MAG: hypothetical protein EHM21_18175, partial [Chloroflexi bacterium]
MKENRKSRHQNGSRPQLRRPTIGLLIEAASASDNQYSATVWAGVVDAARERDVNLICFTGGLLGDSPISEFVMQRHVLFDLVSSDNVDGLVI